VRMPTSCWSATLLMTVLKGLFAWGYFCGGVLSWWTGTAPPYFIVDDWTSLCSMLIDLVFSVQLLGSFPLSYVILKKDEEVVHFRWLIANSIQKRQDMNVDSVTPVQFCIYMIVQCRLRSWWLWCKCIRPVYNFLVKTVRRAWFSKSLDRIFWFLLLGIQCLGLEKFNSASNSE
jgi:hypothetical protein